MKRVMVGAAALLSAMAFAAPAEAATPCANTDVSPTALDCSGFIDGNQLGGSQAMIDAQIAALADLGLTWDGSTILEAISPLNGAHDVYFSTPLVGQIIIGAHFGNGQGGPGNATAFYLIDAGSGLDHITLNYNASSNIILYSSEGVPEPATWMMMLVGFGAVGGVMARRRRKTMKPVPQIA